MKKSEKKNEQISLTERHVKTPTLFGMNYSHMENVAQSESDQSQALCKRSMDTEGLSQIQTILCVNGMPFINS